jgi:hypothetical protein
MSLAIDVDRVTRVLLADGWHEVCEDSFGLDSYEYVEANGHIRHGGGDSGVCATGFAFKTDDGGEYMAGPLTAILAVRYKAPLADRLAGEAIPAT